MLAVKERNGRTGKATNMRYTWIDEYLLQKAGVTKDLQKDWNWLRCQVGGIP